MPSSDHDAIPDFFDADDNIAAQLSGQTSEPEEREHFSFAASLPPSAPPPKKGKKKGKKNAYKTQAQAPEGENSPYGTSVTPSPPKNDGVKLGEDLSKAEEDELVPAVEDNAVFEEIVDPAPEPAQLHQPMPAPSAPARSPRPVPIRPAQNARTPPSRPASLYSPPQQYGSLAGYRSNSSTANPPPLARRESATHTSPRPRFVEPAAPPHKAQPHFYGLPDFGLNFGQQKLGEQAGSGKAAGSEGYCCCFDSFADAGDAMAGKKARDALLVGSEGGLEVFRVLPNKFEVVGRLEGLRGSVIGAKVLPQVRLEDGSRRLRPLVAVVVHGAMVEQGKEGSGEEGAPGFYQTSVEIYSLQEQEYVATLFRSAPVAVEKPTLGHLAAVPGPVGDLSVSAEGRYVMVASGKSGEVFAFSNAATVENPDEEFRCLGKFWTSLQTSPMTAASRPQSSSEGGQGMEEKDEKPRIPLFSLSQRWLALMPPPTSAHVSIGGSPLLLGTSPSPPGLASHVAPPQPPISCDIAGVDAEGAWSRLTRQAAQGLVKYSHIGFEMGRQGWRELTNPTPQSATQHSRGTSREYDAFPPTMAPVDDPGRVVKEPAIVSIIDLDSLLEAEEVKPKYAPPHLSAFALQEGCNFLSLSATGLRLLSVSRSGKVSTIWDLTQSCHGTARLGTAHPNEDETAQGPCVKQLHRFERNSESVVTDAAWSRDDDMLAVLTSHGTVHLHEVPTHPSRKRKRRSTSSISTPLSSHQPTPPRQHDKAQPTVSVSQGMSPPSSNTGWMGSLKSGFAQMSTQVHAVRAAQSGVPTFRPTFAGFREITAVAGQAGGRAIAKGLGKGYSAAKGGMGDYWHAEDNKIRHAALQDHGVGGGGGGVLRWVRRQSGTSLAVVCGGTVHLHPVQAVSRRRGDEVVTGLRHDRYGKKTFALPLIRTRAETPHAKKDACAAEGVHGFWSLRVSPAVEERAREGERMAAGHEVETNPPYCPFHVDPRVSIYAFPDEDGDASGDEAAAWFHLHGHGVDEEEAWVFGAPLPGGGAKLNTRDEEDGNVPAFVRDAGWESDGDEGGGGEDAGVESRVLVKGDEKVQVLTRPARGGGTGRDAGGRFEHEGFDEDGL